VRRVLLKISTKCSIFGDVEHTKLTSPFVLRYYIASCIIHNIFSIYFDPTYEFDAMCPDQISALCVSYSGLLIYPQCTKTKHLI
jgi:hypothetical protein